MLPWITRNLVYLPIQAIRGERVLEYMDDIRRFHELPYPLLELFLSQNFLITVHPITYHLPTLRALLRYVVDAKATIVTGNGFLPGHMYYPGVNRTSMKSDSPVP